MHLRFPRRRPSRADAVWHKATGPAAPFGPLPPQPHDLIDVVGIGATERANGVALTLLSVERYREAYIALFRMLRDRGRLEREFPSPYLELAVMPAGAQPYRFWMMHGGGGGDRELEYRQSYAIAPAPPSDGPEIVIEVRTITWERHGRDGVSRVVSVDTGPWRFAVKR
jgi:hypothetical protein